MSVASVNSARVIVKRQTDYSAETGRALRKDVVAANLWSGPLWPQTEFYLYWILVVVCTQF